MPKIIFFFIVLALTISRTVAEKASLPLSPIKYSDSFYRDLFDELRVLRRDSIILVVQAEVDRWEKEKDYSKSVNLKIVLGLLERRPDIVQSFVDIQSALFEAEKHQMYYEQGLANMELGNIYILQEEKEKALIRFLTGAEIAEKHQCLELAFRILYHMGNLHYESGNYQESIADLKRGLSYYSGEGWMQKERMIWIEVISAYNTIGLSNTELRNYQEAIRAYRKGLELTKAGNEEFWTGLLYGNMGVVYLEQKKYDSATVLINRDLLVSKKNRYHRSVSSCYINLGKIYRETKKLDLAEKYYDSALQIFSREKIMHPSYYLRMAEIHYDKSMYKASIDYEHTYRHYMDSIAKVRNAKKLAMLATSYEFESKLQALQLLEKENDLQDREIKNKNIFILGGLIIAILLIALLFLLARSNRLKLKMNKELEKEVVNRTKKLARTVKELDTFIYRLSHDFRRPLTTLIGLDLLGRTISMNKEITDVFSKVGKTAMQMDRMLAKMSFIHEINTITPYKQDVDLITIVEQTTAKVKEYLNETACDVRFHIPTGLTAPVDPRCLELILINLIENAIIFADNSKSHRTITISATKNPTDWELTVEDNGIGIISEVYDKILDPFFRGSPASEGNGLGLYIVKKAVRKMKGKVTFNSFPGRGTTFTLVFKTP